MIPYVGYIAGEKKQKRIFLPGTLGVSCAGRHNKHISVPPARSNGKQTDLQAGRQVGNKQQ